jgi:hypothetical protein
MSRYDAAQWMLDRFDFRFRPQKGVTASARVLDETVPIGHGRHVVTEYSAQVTHLLVEHREVGVRIAVGGKQQGMSALDADVLAMIVPIDKVLIRVVPEKTGQRVTDTRQGTVRAEVLGPAPAGPLGRIGRCEKNMIVDMVAPQRAAYCFGASEGGSCSSHGISSYEGGIQPDGPSDTRFRRQVPHG